MINAIKRILRWTSVYRKKVYLGFVFAVLEALCGALPISVAGIAVSRMLKDIQGERTLTGGQIAAVAAALVALVLGRWLFSYLRAVTQDSAIYEVSEAERLQIGDKLKRLPLGFFEKNSTGELATVLSTELAFFEMHGMHMIDVIVNSYTFLIVCMIGFLFFEPMITLICALGLAVSGIGLFLIQRASRNNAGKRQEGIQRAATAALEYIRGLAVVKSYNQEGAAMAGVHEAFRNTKDVNIRLEKEYTKPDALHRFALYAATTGIMTFAALAAYQGDMALPVMVMLVLYSFVMFSSVEAVNNSVLVLEILDVTMDKLDKIKQAEPIDKDGRDIDVEHFDIRFDHVSFAYDAVPVISDVSFTIPERGMTAIVGPSGSGKTTLCSLLARFYDVNAGRITLGGENIRAFTCDSLLKHISMVFQNVYLFEDTVMNNIRFGNPKASDDEVYAAAKKARCHDFIMALPNGYDTVVGEGGSTLSGGEKQRVSIARAMLKDAPIVVLDEATASVDPENEHHIQAAISALTSGKTIITIAHRLATIQNADQILVMEEGRIVQSGVHDTLMAERGLYRKYLEIRQRAEGWSLQA